MTLLFCESFDVIDPAELATYGKWLIRTASSSGSFSNYATISTVAGRLSGLACRIGCACGALGSADVNLTVDLGNVENVLFISFGYLDSPLGLAPSSGTILALNNVGQASQVEFSLNGGRQPFLSTAGTVRCTANQVFAQNIWHWMEIAANISTTTGWLEMRIDQIMSATYYGTGTSRATANGNTAPQATTGVRFIKWGSGVSRGATAGSTQGPEFFIDDMVVNNASGTLNNDFPNECQVGGLLPIGTGSFTQFVRGGTTPAPSNWQSVDEVNINDDVDYVTSQTVGATDSYHYTTLPPQASSIRGIQFSTVARKDTVGFRAYRPFVHLPTAGSPIEGTFGGNQVLSSSYSQSRVIAETRPDGPIWTPSDVVLSEFGFRLTA